MESIFFYFLRQQSTAASGSSFFFNWNVFFSQAFISACENDPYLLETVFFYSKFFSANGLKFGGSQIFKKNHIFASGHQFLSFLKVEAVLPYSKNTLQNPTGTNDFSAYRNSHFLNGAISVLLEIISVIKIYW